MFWSFQSKGNQSTVGIGGTNVAILTTDIIKFNNLSVKLQNIKLKTVFPLDDYYRSHSAEQTPRFCWRWFPLYLVLLWLLNVINVQIFKTYSLEHFGVTRKNISAGGLCWCWEMMFCACVICEIRTLESNSCLYHLWSGSVNPEPGRVHSVGVSVDVSGTLRIRQTSNIQLLLHVRSQKGSSYWWTSSMSLSAVHFSCFSGWRDVTVINGASFLFAWLMRRRNRKTRTRHKCSEPPWPWWPFSGRLSSR